MKRSIIAFVSAAAFLITCVEPLSVFGDSGFDNGKVSMEITVAPVKDALSANEKQELKVTFKNTSLQTITIPTFTYDGKTAYASLAEFVLGFVINRIEGQRRTPVKVVNYPPVILTLPSPCPKELNPEESWTIVVDLDTWLWLAGESVQKPDASTGGTLKAGNYEISAVYDISKWSRLTGHDNRYGFVENKFTSTPVIVTVR